MIDEQDGPTLNYDSVKSLEKIINTPTGGQMEFKRNKSGIIDTRQGNSVFPPDI